MVVARGSGTVVGVLPSAPPSSGEALVEGGLLSEPVPDTVLPSSTEGAFEVVIGWIMMMVVSSTV